MLTKQEEATLEAYRVIAAKRNATHANPDFWRQEGTVLAALAGTNASIIDIGCGAGRDALLLRELGFLYVGADASPEMLDAARELAPDALFHRMDLYEPDSPFVFDAFWAAAVYLHVPRERIGEALTALRTILAPGAVGFIALKEGDGEKCAADGRFFCYWREPDFTDVLRANGFTVLQVGSKTAGSDTFLTWHVRA